MLIHFAKAKKEGQSGTKEFIILKKTAYEKMIKHR